MGTAIVGGVLLLAVAAIVYYLCKGKKGKGDCGGDCSHCKGCH